MLDNIYPVEELRSVFWCKKNPNVYQTVKMADVDAMQEKGWTIQRYNSKSARLYKPKTRDVLLEDRVWSLLYRMGFTHMSGKGGAFLMTDTSKSEVIPKDQIDVVAIDEEVAIAVECKTATSPRKPSNFQKDLAKHAGMRAAFRRDADKAFPLDHKRAPVLIMFTWNLILSETDVARAADKKVVLLDEPDLVYYERLVTHLGPAAKYQFYADIMPGRPIRGLEISIPALKSKMGTYTAYSFSITPEYLLKISYIAHRAKGKPTDIGTYQRMIKKSRLKRLREYIDSQGLFPTNIVVSLEGKKLVSFEPSEHQPESTGATYGTLRLRPAYGCAWIIDGQHRLFAYSGHKWARSSHLSVLAFQGLPATEQAQLFVDINHEQKSVSRSLLQELLADLYWDDEDEQKRVAAIVSKAIQALNTELDSPLHDRILLSGDTRDNRRCITVTSLFRSLGQPGMLIVKPELEYGPLWAGDSMKTLKRVTTVVKAWLKCIYDQCSDWWELGSADGGGLAMNDGITVCLGVLRSVFEHLRTKYSLVLLSDEELVKEIRPFGKALGEYFGSLSEEDRGTFRKSCRGIQGQTAQRRICEGELHETFPDFEPPGLMDELALAKAKTNEQAFPLIQSIEQLLQRHVVETLKHEYVGEDSWWYDGVPDSIRKKCVERREDARGAGKLEHYFDLLDYKAVIRNNWALFKDSMAYDGKGKERGTSWIGKVNDIRRIVMHPSKRRYVSLNDLETLREIEAWLKGEDI